MGKDDEIWIPCDMSEQEIDMFFTRKRQFEDRKYAVLDGVVEQRMAYFYEVQGKELPDYLRNKDGEGMEIRGEKEKKVENEKKRQREVQAEKVRAAQRQKTCGESCELEWDDL